MILERPVDHGGSTLTKDVVVLLCEFGLGVLGTSRGEAVGVSLDVLEDHVVRCNLKPRSESEAKVSHRRLNVTDLTETNLLANDAVLTDRRSVDKGLKSIAEELTRHVCQSPIT